MRPEMFRHRYTDVFDGQRAWNEIKTGGGDLYDWDADSTYIQEPPFLVDLTRQAGADPSRSAAPASWLALGDSVTTDHISPAGSIAAKSPAGLLARARRRAGRLQQLRRAARQRSA